MKHDLKFAIVTDNSNEPSFMVKKDKFIRLFGNKEDVTNTDLPYTAWFNYASLFENGCFINLNDNEYPDIKFDIILASVEKNPNHLDNLKLLYPNSLIIGHFKEFWNNNSEVRNYVIQNTKAYSYPYGTSLDFFEKLGSIIPNNQIVLPQPTNHILYQNTFEHKNKEDKIFNYNNKTSGGRSSINNPLILSKTNVKHLNYSGPKGLKNFIESWSKYSYMLSTDTYELGGVQSGQCAILNTIMIGSKSDYQQILFPDLVGTDPNFLLSKIEEIHTNKTYKEELKKYAYNKFLTTFSHKVIKKQIIEIYNNFK